MEVEDKEEDGDGDGVEGSEHQKGDAGTTSLSIRVAPLKGVQRRLDTYQWLDLFFLLLHNNEKDISNKRQKVHHS